MNAPSPKILAIDDEPLVRASIVAFLEDSGFEVLQAENGREGLRVFHEQRPDVILCDLHMPVMSGLDLLNNLREEYENVPFIVVSGAGMVHDAVEALRLGAWDYVVKPITDLSKLEHAIKQALERSQLLHQNQLYREELESTNRELKQSLSVLKEDQEAGRCIQFQLLPANNISYDNMAFSHHIIPSLYLSGDFVDYFDISEEYIGFYIADVSGHGAPSAFVTVLLKSLMDQFINRYRSNNTDDAIINPDQLLKALSKEILKAHLGKYLTMCYGVIHRKTQQLVYSIGGHFPNPVFVVNGKAQFLEGNGFPVGVFEKAEYKTHELVLPEEFALILFSDGVLEILEQQALEDKENFLLSLVSKTPSAIAIPTMLDELGLTNKHGMPDDVTFLVIKRGK